MFRSRVLTRSTARLLVCFYVLASCRALIPGLCATQAAILEGQQSAGSPAVAATHSCCTLAQPQQDSSEQQLPVRKSSTPKCAFCELVKGFVTPSPFVTLDAATESRYEQAVPITETRYVSRVWDPSLARDPPTANLA